MEYLAEGGYAVGKLATLHFPEGIRLQNELGLERAIAQTKEELQKENIVLFEPALLIEGKVAAPRILSLRLSTYKEASAFFVFVFTNAAIGKGIVGKVVLFLHNIGGNSH